jgi:DNA-binding response OmpR family regulator
VKILVVDDDQINAKMLSKRLIKRGFEVETLFCGNSCIEYIEKHNDIDLILLDIMMPDLSGLEVLTIIRKKYSTMDLPVIMVTAKGEASDVVDAMKKGANDYIQKPVNMDIAEARVRTHLSMGILNRESIVKKELETANAMIVTYNHEINNPLTIAMGMLRKCMIKEELDGLEKVEHALNRIAEIVKKIDKVSQESSVQTDRYTEGQSMIKLK